MYTTTRRQLLKLASLAGLMLTGIGCSTDGRPKEAVAPRSATAADVEPTVTPEATASDQDAATPTPTIAQDITPEANEPTADEIEEPAYMSVVHGTEVERIVREAIALIGGMERFVKPGYDVIIKPNICNANHGPEYASTTNPQVIAALVTLCLDAGAGMVRVMDNPFAGTAEAAYERSGIRNAVELSGGRMEIMASAKYVEASIPEGQDLTSWQFYRPILDADLVINVPVAKHHSLAILTLAGKNLMGTIDNRPAMHRNLGQRIADITSRVRPQLTVMDAVRILTAHGPTGGNLEDVQRLDTVIASHDLVAVDAYAATLFGLTGSDVSYVARSAEMGLGRIDLDELNIVKAEV